MALKKHELALGERLKLWKEHPAVMVRELFKIEPDAWQIDVLEAFPHHQRLAMQACKGPGKTAVLAWLCWNFMLTRSHPNIGATSISGDNLKDGLWKEMSIWRQAAPLLQQLFEMTSNRIFFKQFPDTWFMSARTWPRSGNSEQQANTLAGLHKDNIMFVLDESGGIPDAVMVAADAALSSCVEGHILQAGNPTNLEGPLYRAARSWAAKDGRWHVTEITGDPDDPKRSPRVKIDWARDMINDFGVDDNWVRVNVFGKFPTSSFNSLISIEDVEAAQKRSYREYDYDSQAKIIGIDVARQGDDQSVILRRQGLQMFTPQKYRSLNGLQGGTIAARVWDEFGADACFVDATGGFGFTWIEQLQRLGKSPIPVGFAEQASRKERYYNRRSEMAFNFVEWIKGGGALPPSQDLSKALVSTTYTHKNDRLILEEKAQIKARLGFSPDDFDAAILTFAAPVQTQRRRGFVSHNAMPSSYDPFREVNGSVAQDRGDGYDPFRY